MKIFITVITRLCLFAPFAQASYKITVVDVKSQPTAVKKMEAKPEEVGVIVGKTLGEVAVFL